MRDRPRIEYWHILVGLFFTGWVLMYANRTVLSPLMKVFGAEWGLSKTGLGLLTSAFFMAYALLQIPSGFLADRLGRKRVLLAGFLVHGIGALASGLVSAPGPFLAVRVGTGLGQSTYYASHYALASDAIPREKRALGNAIINSGMGFGLALGSGLAGWLVYSAGLSWRWPFVILAGITLVLAAVMAVVLRPAPRPAPSPAPARTRPAANPGWVKLILDRTMLRLYVIAICTMYGFYVILTWLPYYLQEVRGFSGAGAGLAFGLVPFAAVPAGILAGRLSDRSGSRKKIIGALIPVATLGLLAIEVLPGRAGLFLGIILYGSSGKLVIDPLLVALAADTAPPSLYATAFGVLNFASAVPTVLAPLVTGYLADRTGNFAVAFYLAAALQGVALLALAGIREASIQTRVDVREPAGDLEAEG